MSDNILEINQLSKRFINAQALDNVTFNVEKGEICGLLGPNGAGKTTLLRIINNILLPDSGSVTIFGEEASLKTSRMLGYMPEERGLYDQMRVEDQILYFGRLKGGDPKRLREVMKEYLEIFELTGQERRRVKELSKGNQQKVQIIATLVHEPPLVVLDEPFSGFDPINGALLKDLIARLHENGTTIILSSHNMDAIEQMCQSIALISKGKLLIRGRIDDIKEARRTNLLKVTTPIQLDTTLLIDSGTVMSSQPTATPHHRKGYSYLLEKSPNASNTQILNQIAFQTDPVHFEEVLPSLEDIFIQLTTNNN